MENCENIKAYIKSGIKEPMFSIAPSAQDINFDNNEEGKDLEYFVWKAISRVFS